MIVGLQRAAEYMTRQGRVTTERGLQTLLSRGRYPGIGRRDGTMVRAPYVFTEEELDRLIAEVRSPGRSSEQTAAAARDERGRFVTAS